jgi:cytochrome c biogenesis protein
LGKHIIINDLTLRSVKVEKEEDKGFIDRIWDFFASIRLAIVVFASLALTSIIGTVLEQNADPERNIRLLAKLFGESAAPSLFSIFESLGFMDMYHSWWFVTILMLFAANLIICSIDRLPKIMKVVKEPIRPLSEDRFKGFGIKKEFVLSGNPEKTKGVVSIAIKKVLGFNLSEAKEENGYQLYSQKGNYTRLGVYITHFSILVILLGAVVGIFFGFKGFLNLPEGKTYSVAFSRTGSRAQTQEFDRIINAVEASRGNLAQASQLLGTDENSLRTIMRKFGIFPLGFSIRCDMFNVDFYGKSDMPKAYRSWLSVIKDGKEVTKKVIEVNEPLKYEGITFYQSSYGPVPGGVESGIFRFRGTPKNGRTEELNARFGGSFTLPGTTLTAKIEDFSPALGFDQATNKPFTYTKQMNNPAVLVSFSESGNRKFGGWILMRYPETWSLPDGYTLEFAGLWGSQYTGLQVRKDPGVWIVYLGCIAMAVGLFIAFFMSHRRIWVKLTEERSNTRVIIGASSNKNKQAFERKVDKLVSHVTKTKEGGK